MSIDPETMEELLATETAQRSLRPLRVGETVEGTIAAVAGHEATVDLGDLPAGVIPLHEVGSVQLQVGEHVVAVVTQVEDPDGRVVLSLRRVRNRKQWVQLEEMKKNGDVIDAPVVEANRGGVVVDVGMRGFVPLSQLVSVGAIDAGEAGVPQAVMALVGKHLQVVSSRQTQRAIASSSRRRQRRSSCGATERRAARRSYPSEMSSPA